MQAITPQVLRDLNKNFRAIFWDAYQGGGAVPLVDQFAMLSPSSAAENVYGWLGSIPGLAELIGEFAVTNLRNHAYAIKNLEFGRIIGVQRADIERDNLGTYRALFQALGLTARQHPDELLVNRMLNGFTNKCYTNKNFFDADHEPVAGKVKFTNLGTKKLSGANFKTARTNIMSRLNAEGQPMNLGVDLVLVVSPQYDDVAREIVLADRNAAGATNVMKGTARHIASPRLAADPHKWFLFDLGQPVKPFINQVEVDTEFTAQDKLDDDSVFEKSEFRYKAYRRGNVGYGMPELAYGSTGADAA